MGVVLVKKIIIKKLFGWLIAEIAERVNSRSLLSYDELVELIEQGVINADIANVNATSIDLTLADKLLVEGSPRFDGVVSLDKGETIGTNPVSINKERGYVMGRGEFVLGSTQEVFNLPDDISAEYKLKSSMARSSLDHLNAGWIDAGFEGTITLELKSMSNNHELKIAPGMLIGQVVFFRHKKVPKHASYASKGRYNGQLEVTASKGIR